MRPRAQRVDAPGLEAQREDAFRALAEPYPAHAMHMRACIQPDALRHANAAAHTQRSAQRPRA
jgi:hypothetical protein